MLIVFFRSWTDMQVMEGCDLKWTHRVTAEHEVWGKCWCTTLLSMTLVLLSFSVCTRSLYIRARCAESGARLLHLIPSTSSVLTHTQLFTSSVAGIHYLTGIFLFIMEIDVSFFSEQWSYLQQANYATMYTLQFMIRFLWWNCACFSL